MEQEINEIIAHNNTIQEPLLSEKIELKIQKQNNITIPSIIFEYLSPENEIFELEDLKKFFNHFGEVLNITIIDKKSIILFKTFFIANICKEFLEKEACFKENMKKNFSVRWFDFEKDESLLPQKIKPIFNEINKNNIINIKRNSVDNNIVNNQNNNTNNSNNNNIGIKMNMNMNINNFNINTTMNPMAHNQNMIQMQNLQYLQLLQLAQAQSQMKMNKNMQNNNIPPQGMGNMPNYNLNQIQLQQQNPINPLNMFMNKQNINNMNNNFNNMNLINNMNNNIKNPLMNQNLPQINNQQFNPNLQQNNLNQNLNNNNINNTNNNNDEKNFGKYTCKYEILIANDKNFQIARRLIGSKGCNMKNIINKCKVDGDGDGEGIKLRLRGKGSGYKEGPQNKESDEPLHLCISSKNPEEMKKACLLVDELLNKIHKEYKEYCEKNNVMPANTQIAMRIDNKSGNFKSK